MIAILSLSQGLFRQGTSHWGFFATLGAPPVANSFESGIHNVYTAWYVADAQVGAAYSWEEATFNTFFYLVAAGNMIYHNTDTYGLYFWFGIIQAVVAYIFLTFKSIVLAYDAINASYLQSRYLQDTWVTIKFGTLWNFFGEDSTIL